MKRLGEIQREQKIRVASFEKRSSYCYGNCAGSWMNFFLRIIKKSLLCEEAIIYTPLHSEKVFFLAQVVLRQSIIMRIIWRVEGGKSNADK